MNGGVLELSNDTYDPLELERHDVKGGKTVLIEIIKNLINKSWTIDEKIDNQTIGKSVGNYRLIGLIDFRTMAYQPICAFLFIIEYTGQTPRRQHYVLMYPDGIPPPTVDRLVSSMVGMHRLM